MNAKISNCRLCKAATLTLGLLVADPVLAGACARPHERAALDTRTLQTDLMVAALSCRHQPLYNAFVRKYRGELLEHGRALQSFFRRQHGATGPKQLNGFITRLANGASRRSQRERRAFCARAAAMFDQLLHGKPMSLETLLDGTAMDHGVPSCSETSVSQNLSAGGTGSSGGKTRPR